MFASRESFSARIALAVTLGRSLGLPGSLTGTTVDARDIGHLLTHRSGFAPERSAGQNYPRVGRYDAQPELLASH